MTQSAQLLTTANSTALPTVTVRCHINQQPCEFQVPVALSLLELLRNQGLTSVKQGCAVGECGACTVLVDDIAVDSCLYLAAWIDGKQIRTAEGEVKGEKLSVVQQAYVDSGAVQCGFCTPGFVMTSTALVEKYHRQPLTVEQIRRGLAGNLCRCTGYEMVVEAVQQAQKRQA